MAGRRAPRQLEILEDRTLLAAALSEFMDPNPAAGNLFGHSFVALSTGNIVITSPLDDFGGTDAGAVYLFNGATGVLISTLRGSKANDIVRGGLSGGGVTALSNGNYVVSNFSCRSGALVWAGAVTFGNGTSGTSGTITSANSAIGLTSSTSLQPIVVDNVNNTFFARFLAEGGGKVRVGSQFDSFANDPPTVPVDNDPAANSVPEVFRQPPVVNQATRPKPFSTAKDRSVTQCSIVAFRFAKEAIFRRAKGHCCLSNDP